MKLKLLVAILSSFFLVFWCCKNQPKEVTFAKDIAPIIHANCSPCHNANGAGPFNLISYQDVANKAKTIAKVTKIRYMPPWPADPNYSHFKNEKYLSNEEIELIQQWVKQGKKQGDLKTIVYPEFNYFSDLGKPDLVLDLPYIKINGNGGDQFNIVKVLGNLPQDTFLRAIEFVPHQKGLVHHVNGFALNYSYIPNSSKKAYINLESNSYEKDFKTLALIAENKPIPERIHSAFNYLPGVFAAGYPEGIGGFKLKKNFGLVCNDLHFGPSEKDLIDSSKIYLYFAKSPPRRSTKELMMGTNGVSAIKPALIIAPDTVMVFRSSLYIPESISILTINPHMHLIGKSFKAYAVNAKKDTLPLISIPKWDFRWQYFYTFKKMLKIEAGSTIYLEAVFDNTQNNKNNPFNPARTIRERADLAGAGMRTTDEMLQFIITYLPYEIGDENTLL